MCPGFLMMAARLTCSRENIRDVDGMGLWHSILNDALLPFL